MPSNTSCKLPKLSLMLDMSGMVSCCQHSTYWLRNEQGHMYTVKDNLSDVWNSKSRHDWVAALESGERVPECQECWGKEDIGVESIRQFFNQHLSDVEPVTTQPRIISIKPGIMCNNACRSCNEQTSSMWFKDAYEFDRETQPDVPFKTWLQKWQPHVTIYKDNASLEQTFDAWQEHMIFWDIYGGEPLTIPLSYRIIQGAADSGFASNQEIQIHTNGTVYDPALAKMFEKFRSVIFAVSIDGIGAKNDYLRHGSEFDKVIANLTQYHNDLKSTKHVQLYVRCTPTPLNVYGIDEYCEYFDKTGICYTINNYAVDEPHNNIQYMPESIKQKVADKLQNVKHPQVDQLIRFMMGTPADLAEKQLAFWKHNTKLDQIRKQSFADVFPEWHAVWQEYLAE